MAFPTQGILDNFNRADDNSPPPGANWSTVFNGHDIISNTLRGHTTSDSNISQWVAATYGPSIEGYITNVANITDFGMWILDSGIVHGYYVGYDAGSPNRIIIRRDVIGTSETEIATVNQTLSAGDSLGIYYDAAADTIYAYYKIGAGAWTEATHVADSNFTDIDSLFFFSFDNTATFDNFGGGTAGTTFNQSATGGFTPAGAILKQDAKVLTGAATPAGALLKQDQKILTGAITPAGAILNQAGKVLAGAITPTGVVATLRTAYAVLTGAIIPTGTLVKETQRALTGAFTPAGALLNQAQKVLSGDITPTSTLGTIKTFLLDLVGSITPAGSLLKETQKIFTGSITPVGSLLKEIQKAFSGSITPAGAFAGIKVAYVVLVGSVTPAGNLLRETQKTLTGVVTPLGLITKLTGKLLDGILAPTGALVTLFVGAGTTMAQSTFKGMFRGMFRRMR